ARDRSDDQEGLFARRNLLGQRSVGRLVGQVFLASEEPHHRAALLRDLIPDRAEQRRVARLQSVQHRPLRRRASDLELDHAADAGQYLKIFRQNDLDHDSVWTSTDSTGGRSRTIASQLSPPSGDAYTCPPLVPKYTPQGSSESTAIASRRTLT